MADIGAQLFIDAAQRHGEDSEPDHEVGDLQDFLRAAFRHMTPEQRKTLSVDQEVMRTLCAAIGADDDAVEDPDALYEQVQKELLPAPR